MVSEALASADACMYAHQGNTKARTDVLRAAFPGSVAVSDKAVGHELVLEHGRTLGQLVGLGASAADGVGR